VVIGNGLGETPVIKGEQPGAPMIVQAKKLLCFAGVAAFICQFVSGSARAQSIEEFYWGRTVEIYVGVSVGGGSIELAQAHDM
jgi:hypothetical protein